MSSAPETRKRPSWPGQMPVSSHPCLPQTTISPRGLSEPPSCVAAGSRPSLQLGSYGPQAGTSLQAVGT